MKDGTGLRNLMAARMSGSSLNLTAPLTTTKAQVAATADGSLRFSDAKGREVGRLRSPVMWDGQVDARSGDPVNRTPVSFALSSAGTVLTPVDPGRSGKLELSVKADGAWLSDPGRVFPITVDPTYASGSSSIMFDTFVEQGFTADESADGELKVGNNGQGQVARSFVNVSTSTLLGKHVLSGSLSLYETWSANCTAHGWSAYDAGLASSSTRWTAQPSIGTKYATSTQTKGWSGSCPGGRVSIDMSGQLQAWSQDSATSQGLALKADSETDSLYWKRFESSDGSDKPVLTWTYNRPPATPATPTVSGVTMFKPAGSSTSYPYVRSASVAVSAVMSDADANTVSGHFYAFGSATATSGQVAQCNSSFVASGATAGCTMSGLPADGSVWVRALGYDSINYGALSSTPREVRVASGTPAAPVISCPAPYTNGSWATSAPTANVSCTISAVGTGYSAPSKIRWLLDNAAAYTDSPITQSASASVAKITVSVPKTPGGHNLRVYAVTPVGISSATPATYTFGYGSASLTAPTDTPRITTTGKITIGAAGPPRGTSPAPTAKTQWRVSGATGTTGWVDAPAGHGLSVVETNGQNAVSGTFDTTSVVGQADGSGVSVNGRVPTLIDVRVCMTYTTQQCTGQATVLRVPHAFGSGFPTADAGPGQVALWTGELQVDDADAALTTPDGTLSVSRTHSSFAGVATPQDSVFGPGWTASLDGDGNGAGGSELYDGTNVDGTLAVVDAGGDALVFTTPTGARRTTATIPSGTYVPADEDTKTGGDKLVVSGTGAATVAEVTGDDGVVTRFQVTAAPTTGSATFKTVEVRDPAVAQKTSYAYDGAGRVTAIVAGLPDGISTCVPGTPTNGCRVLKITYATQTTATASTPGDYSGRASSIVAQVNTDPDRTLATYKYDSAGRLVQATDTRSNLTTGYGWTGSGSSLRLTSLTPAGLTPYQFGYDTAANKLQAVTRANPPAAGGGTAQLTAFVYGLPTSGPGLPDLSATSVGRWNQASPPTWGAAVFGPDKPVTSTNPAGIASGDWAYADLQYTDAQGYTVNTASYGAGDWQLTAADYDTHDNVVHAWDERALRGIIDGTLPGGDNATDSATLTVYNDDIKDATGAVVTPAGTLVSDTYTPVRNTSSATAAADDPLVPLRAHSHTSYDQGAPNGDVNPATGQPYRLPTQTVTTAEDSSGAVDSTTGRTFTGYEPVAPGDTSGWALGEATTVTTDMDLSDTNNAGDITATTRYDSRGRTIEARQPKSTGSDAGTRVTVYYTGDGSASVSGCRNQAKYAGYACQVGPAAQPAGQPMPVTTTTGYTWDGQATTSVDTSGSVTSTTTISYDSADRPTTVATSVTGLPSSTPVPPVTTSYDPATGLTTGTSSGAGSTATGYDGWGRAVTYTNTPAGQPADTSTTSYDITGKVVSVVDTNGQTSFGYDGTDAAGQTEHRGLTTSVKVKLTGGAEYTSTGGYDAGGDLSYEALPGNLIRRATIDLTGDQTSLTYNGQAVDPGTGQAAPDQPWLGWSTTSDVTSRVIREWTPDGAAGYTGALGAVGVASDRRYRYDQAGRLTTVEDRTGNPDPATGVVGCTDRAYAFDANGNRTGQNSIPGDANGGCTTTGGSPVTRGYDTADRPTSGANGTGAYLYDPLGRQLTIPAADTATPTSGDIALGYYDSDAIATISQGILGSGGTRTSFTLDGVGRRLVQTTQTDTGTSTLVRHYTDDSDNPTWTADTTAGANTITRYNELVDGNLGLTLTATIAGTTAQLDLSTPRGDVATTITLPDGATAPGGTPAVGLDSWTDYTECGTSRQTVDTRPGGVTGIGYGWLGGKQRATLSSGLSLMGARLYNVLTGLFTSIDPEAQGGDTAYGYPIDPVNYNDLSDHFWGSIGRFLWRNKWDIALTAASFVPGLGVAAWGCRAYRLYRFVRAAQTINRVYRTYRATRATSWLAGRMWVGRGAVRGVARNGARWLRSTRHVGREWRSASRSGRGWKSNFTYGVNGYHTYRNVHVEHYSFHGRWAI